MTDWPFSKTTPSVNLISFSLAVRTGTGPLRSRLIRKTRVEAEGATLCLLNECHTTNFVLTSDTRG